jgi:hypothetical protein
MYRSEDIEKIQNNIDTIKTKAIEIYKKNNPPTFQENAKVYNIIKNYIIQNKNIVYGGLAQHLLIKKMNFNDGIYKELDGAYYKWPDLADIEFYSPKPLEDVIKLTDELYKNKFEYIQGREGVHQNTYKISVNNLTYCDISYMPDNIYNNVPIIIIDNMKLIHPHFMLVDTYRILTDPLTSYWRVDKSIIRFQKILKYYPLNFSNKKLILDNIFNNEFKDILRFIRKNIIHNSKYIIVGSYCYNYYASKLENTELLPVTYYELISEDINRDSKYIYKLLNKKYNKMITIKEFFPFFMFMDKRVEFYYNKKLILIIHGNNSRCTVYKYSEKKKTHFATFNLIILYLLFWYFYYQINNIKQLTDNCLIMICRLLKIRNDYLDMNNITVMDRSPFEDFTYDCYGETIDPLRLSFLNIMQKKSSNKLIKFTYTPSGKSSKIPNYVFANISGNQINNKKYLIIKNNI